MNVIEQPCDVVAKKKLGSIPDIAKQWVPVEAASL